MGRKRHRADDIDYSCPSLDQIIKEIESVRSVNDQLRSLAIEMEDEFDYVQSRLDDAELLIKKLEDEISYLNEQISNLEQANDPH